VPDVATFAMCIFLILLKIISSYSLRKNNQSFSSFLRKIKTLWLVRKPMNFE